MPKLDLTKTPSKTVSIYSEAGVGRGMGRKTACVTPRDGCPIGAGDAHDRK
jgi:hypothetical protein